MRQTKFFVVELWYMGHWHKKNSRFYVVKFCDRMPQIYIVIIHKKSKSIKLGVFSWLMYCHTVNLGHHVTKFYYIKLWNFFCVDAPYIKALPQKIWFASFNGKGVSSLNKSTRLILYVPFLKFYYGFSMVFEEDLFR